MKTEEFLKNMMDPDEIQRTISIDEFSIDEIIRVSNSIEQILMLPGINKKNAFTLSEFNVSLKNILECEAEKIMVGELEYS
jgi:hypothetical protein